MMQLVSAALRWLSLIVPTRIILGTRHDDVLSARAEGNIVLGLSGDDTLSSEFNRTTLIGGSGDDTLTTEFTVQLQAGAPAHARAVQFGNDGDDDLRANVGIAAEVTVGRVEGNTVDIRLDGGTGDDAINAASFVVGPALVSVTFTTEIRGGSGNDFINVVADAEGAIRDSATRIRIHGDAGNDRIYVLADTEHDGLISTIENVLTGGAGNDTLDATARGRSNGTELVSNSLSGGLGNDVLRAFNLTDSNTSTPVGINRLSGGLGNDNLRAIHSTDGENAITDVTSILDGGSGNDVVTADTTALGFSARALNSLAGRDGHDRLTARLEAVASTNFIDVSLDVSNVLNGGSGNDSLKALLSAHADVLEQGDRAENSLNGGAGNDRLSATVAPGSIGRSLLSGGAGDDLLTAVGGSGNILDGGAGNDRLVGGTRTDRFVGGQGVDTYVINPTLHQGTDTFADFAFAGDIFSIAGLTDQGGAGLADDLDAVSTFDDLGLGKDVIVTFDAGTELVLKGLGTGTVDSWTKVVSDSSTQLVFATA